MCDISSQIPLNMPECLVFLTLELSESEQSLSCLNASVYTLLPPFVFTNVFMLSLAPAPTHDRICPDVNLHPQLHLLSFMLYYL